MSGPASTNGKNVLRPEIEAALSIEEPPRPDEPTRRNLQDAFHLAHDAYDGTLDLGVALKGMRLRIEEIERATAKGDGSSPFTTLADLYARPELLKPPEAVLPPIAYRGRLVVFSGPDKAGKSTLFAHGAAAITTQRRFLNALPVHGRVVWVGLEEALSDAVLRFHDLGANPDRVQLLTTSTRDVFVQTRSLLADWPADLVLIDSLTEYARTTLGSAPKDGDNAGWADVVRPLSRLAHDSNTAFVVLHHVRREDGQSRGAGDIAATADALFEMEVAGKGEDPNIRRIKGRARWPVEPFSVALRDGVYQLDGGTPLSRDALILIHVEQNPGCSLRDLREKVGGRTEVLSGAVRTLISRGAIEDRGAGDRMALYPLARTLP